MKNPHPFAPSFSSEDLALDDGDTHATLVPGSSFLVPTHTTTDANSSNTSPRPTKGVLTDDAHASLVGRGLVNVRARAKGLDSEPASFSKSSHTAAPANLMGIEEHKTPTITSPTIPKRFDVAMKSAKKRVRMLKLQKHTRAVGHQSLYGGGSSYGGKASIFSGSLYGSVYGVDGLDAVGAGVVKRNRFMISPSDHWFRKWDMFVQLCMVLSVFAVPYYIFFVYQVDYFVWVLDAILLVNMLITFRVGFDIGDGAETMNMDSRQVALRYLKTGFVLDLMCLIPIEVFAIAAGRADLFGICRLPKAFLSIKVIRRFRALEWDTRAHFETIRVANIYHQFILFSLWLAAIWFAFGAATPSWISVHDAELPDLPIAYQFLDSVYFSMSLLTIGYHTLLPVSLADHIICGLASIANLAIAAYVCGAFSSLLSNSSSKNSILNQKMGKLEKYIDKYSVPRSLATKLKSYIQSCHETNAEDDKLIEQFPSSVRSAVAILIYADLIKQDPLFKYCDPAFVEELAVALRPDSVAAGDKLCVQGNIARHLFFVLKGSVRALAATPRESNRALSSDCCVGALPFVCGLRHPVSIECVTPCTVLSLSRSAYDDVLKLSPSQERLVLDVLLGTFVEDVAASQHDVAVMWNHREQEFLRLLCYAAWESDLNTIKLLVLRGCDVNLSDYDGRTALHLAAVEGRTKILEFLLEQEDIDVNCTDRWGNTPAAEALTYAHDDCLAMLQAQGGQLRLKKPAETLCDAASQGDLSQIKRLIQFSEININAGDYDARTALHLCCAEGKVKVVDFLVNAGADVNAVDRWGSTPLQDALRAKHSLVMNRLVDAGAKLGLDSHDISSLLCELTSNADEDGIDRLIQCRVDLGASDYDGRTAMHLAASENGADILLLLLRGNAPVSPVDRWGNTPLNDAIQQHSQECCDVLMEFGATVDPSSLVDRMLDAAAKGDLTEMKWLVNYGASVSEGDYDSRTPLHLAAAEGHGHAVKFLVVEGADINALDRNGGTPLSDAKRNNHSSIVTFLRSRGASDGALTKPKKGSKGKPPPSVLTLSALSSMGSKEAREFRRVVTILPNDPSREDAWPPLLTFMDIRLPLNEQCSQVVGHQVHAVYQRGGALVKHIRAITSGDLLFVSLGGDFLAANKKAGARSTAMCHRHGMC